MKKYHSSDKRCSNYTAYQFTRCAECSTRER